jgi:hypothetical protein
LDVAEADIQAIRTECNIIAIGKTSLPNERTGNLNNIGQSTDEEFVCALQHGGDLPISATAEQIQELRFLLNNGTLVSAESVVEVFYREPLALVEDEYAYSQSSLTLPPGNIILQTTNKERTTDRLTYEGEISTLAIRVIDKNGLAIDDANTISDKLFGTFGDTATMYSQFAECSFNKLKISWRHSSSITKELSAPGVLEVEIPISITEKSQDIIRSAVINAANDKLGITLPGPFHHVMVMLEGCYVDCGWAAYAYVNSWLSVYQGVFYSFPGVQLHEIG